MLGALTGCPQLLDDSFQERVPLSDVGFDSGGDTPLSQPDAGGTIPRPPPVNPDAASAELRRLLAHRYTFDGSGSNVLDSVGSAHGTSIGASLDGSGKLSLASSEQYVDLPSGLISAF